MWPSPGNSAKVNSTPVTGRRDVRGAPSSPCEGGAFGFGRGPTVLVGPRNLSYCERTLRTTERFLVRHGGLEVTAPPSQGEDGAPEGIKVGEERVPAGSYLTNVIKAVPFKFHRADAA